jgi:nicotinate phosphoribosyltransferase
MYLCLLILTENIRQDFASDPDRARKWTGLRQDSGDPFLFGPRAKEVYESLGINPQDKLIVHSDALSVDKAVKLQKLSEEVGYKGLV